MTLPLALPTTNWHSYSLQDPDNSSLPVSHDNASDDQYHHRYFAPQQQQQQQQPQQQQQQQSFETPKNDEPFKDYSYTQAHSVDHYFDENRARPESSNRQYYKVPINSADSDGGKYLSDNNRPSYQQPSQSNGNSDEPSVADLHPSEPEPYGKNQNNQHSNYMTGKPHRQPYSVYNDEQSMIHPDSAVHMLKNIAQPDYAQSHGSEQTAMTQSSADHEMQSLINQFTNQQSMAMKPNHDQHSLQQDFPSPNMNEFAQFPVNESPMGAPNSMSDINGIAGFQPAPEGGQLPAPPGYKHVGYITIPAGAANLPNMVSQPNSGLPLIRPIPINSAAEMGKLNKNKQDSKKNQDKQVSESKPVRSFLSRLNPLNMLRRLRQRRERRQTSDISSSDYMPLSSKYAAGYGGYHSGMHSASAYPMSPYGSSYGSISGLGGAMSGMNSLYSSMASPSQMYSPSYGSYAYGGYPSAGYSGYGYMPHAASYMAPATDMKAASSSATGDMSAAASAPQAAASHMPMGMGGMPMMPMSMPGMSGMSGYSPMGSMGMMGSMGSMGSMGYPGMGSMGSMPMGSMPMPYGYPGHGMQSPASSSSSSSSSSDSNNPLAGQTLPGGINLADLLKDEEDEPSKFRKFLGYLNPMNIIKRFRNNTSDERKRLGRYKRDVQMYLVNVKQQQQKQQAEERSDSAAETHSPTLDSADQNSTSSADLEKSDGGEATDEMDDILAHDTAPKAVHGRKKGFKRAKYNLMGSRNFEIIRGGTFQADDVAPLRSSEPSAYEQTATNNENNGLSEVDEEVFDNEAPEIMGFQGFNGFSSLYNTLSATKQTAHFAEPSKASSSQSSAAVHPEQKGASFQSIEHAAISSSELKAIS